MRAWAKVKVMRIERNRQISVAFLKPLVLQDVNKRCKGRNGSCSFNLGNARLNHDKQMSSLYAIWELLLS